MSLRIVIFGASGPTGLALTRQALARDHEVTAVTRRPQLFEQQSKQVRVVSADVYKPATVTAAIADHDVVLSVVGTPFSWRAITVYSQSAMAIVQGMQEAGVQRLLCVSSAGTNPGFNRDEGFVFGFIIKPTIGRSTYEDMRRQEQIVMNSGLAWTIVRPARLISHTQITPYQVQEGFVVPGKLSTTRQDLADFLLSNMVETQYLQKAVAIGSTI